MPATAIERGPLCAVGLGIFIGEAEIAIFFLLTDVQGRFNKSLAHTNDVGHLKEAGGRHHLYDVLPCKRQSARIDEVQDDRESVWGEGLEGGGGRLARLLGVLRKQHLEIATAGKQHVAMSFEDLPFHEDVAVTKHILSALLIQLLQEVRLV